MSVLLAVKIIFIAITLKVMFDAFKSLKKTFS